MIALILAACLLCPPWIAGDVTADQSWWSASLDHAPTWSVQGGSGYMACEQPVTSLYICVLAAQGIGRTVVTVDDQVIERRYPLYLPRIMRGQP